MFAFPLPDDPGWNAANTNHEGGDDMCGPPLLRHSSSDGEGNENESEDGN
jgi:hypothetical protein